MSLASRFDDRVLELLWSLWAELGVSGWQRRHSQIAIDPEPLILLTATFAEADPRLRDETIDWCIRYGRYISGPRLRNLLRSGPTSTRDGFGPFAATVAAHGGPRWWGATEPVPFNASRRSKLERADTPALVVIRLRGLFGTTARAELLRVYLVDPQATYTAAELAVETAFTKRNVAEELDGLSTAGILNASRRGNQLTYGLIDPLRLLHFVGNLPLVFPQWSAIFRILARVRGLVSESTLLPQRVRAIETRRLLKELQPDLRLANMEGPRVDRPSPAAWDVWPELERWATRITEALATGDPSAYIGLMPSKRRSVPSFRSEIERLADVSPPLAVMEAWRRVELSLRSELQHHPQAHIDLSVLPNMAIRSGLLSIAEEEPLMELLSLRNVAAHSLGNRIDRTQAIEAGELAYQLLVAIELAAGRTARPSEPGYEREGAMPPGG